MRYLVAQTVKNLPAMLETWHQSQGWEDPLDSWKRKWQPTLSILAWKILWTEESDVGVGKTRMQLSTNTTSLKESYIY